MLELTELRLLSRDETRAYVEHRCTLAGAHANPFDDDAQESIFEMIIIILFGTKLV